MGYTSFLIVLAIIIIVAVGIVLGKKAISHAHHEAKVKSWHSQNIEYELHLRHLGGLPNFKEGSYLYIRVNEKKLDQMPTVDFLDNNKKVLNTISIDQITDCEMKDKVQIKNGMTSQKYVTFGISYASPLMLPATNTYYLILSYIQNGVKIDCLFNNSHTFGDFVRLVNSLRTKSA